MKRSGMHMPHEMHMIARNMHAAASEFARTAHAGGSAKALTALVFVICVTCHCSYRTQ